MICVATLEWSESNTLSESVTDGITSCNFGSVDNTGIVPKDYMIASGDNSFEKWLRLHVKANVENYDIQDLKVWMSRGSNPYNTTYLKTNAKESPDYDGAQVYDTINGPLDTDRSATYDYNVNLPTTEPSTPNLGIGGSLSGSMQSGYSDYLILQLQVGANDIDWQEMELMYSFVEV